MQNLNTNQALTTHTQSGYLSDWAFKESPTVLCNKEKHSTKSKSISNFFAKFVLALFVSIMFLTNTAKAQVFGAAAAPENISTGSYIINMGVSPQTINNGLKPYGLIYDLLKNNQVPIKWVINQTKVKDGTDFTYNGVAYKGGTFIISAAYRTAAVNAKITSYGVTGTTTTSSLSVNVTQTLTSAPKWTLDATNGAIATSFFTNAGIPASAYNFTSPSALGACNDIFVMPHADPTWATHGNLYNWNRTYKGAIWAGCHAVSVLENMNNGSLQTNFLANNTGAIGNALVPFGSHAGGTPPYTHQNATLPAAQYIGKSDGAHLNGSEQIYLPKSAGWRSTTSIIAYDPTQSNVPSSSPGLAAVIATGRAFGNSNYGWVMYEAGHDIDGTAGTTAEKVAAQRAFFDFSFLASIDKVPTVSTFNIPTQLNSNTSYPVSVTAAAVSGTLTYAWSSSCGGSFASATSSSTTFTAPTITSTTNCIIKCIITDACGRNTIVSQPIVITLNTPPAPVADVATISSICGVAPSNTKNVLANDVSPMGRPLTLTSVTSSGALNGIFSYTASGNVTFTPTTGYTGNQVFNYTVCDNTTPTNLCSSSTYTITIGSGAVPTATNDIVTIAEDKIAIINVLANDAGTGLSVVGITVLPTNGKVSINLDNTITYIPNADFAGTDVFTYKIKNADGNMVTATVTITVTNDSCDGGTMTP